MKKILCFLMCALVLLALGAMPAFAEEISEDAVTETDFAGTTVDPEVDEEVDAEDGTEEEISDEVYTLLDRVKEYYNKYSVEVLTAGGDVALIAAYIAYFIWQKLKNKDVKDDLKKVISNTGDVAVSQGGVVGAANGLIDGYNAASKKIDEFMQFYAQFQEKDAERDLLLSRLLVQNSAMMEIIQTAYANSQLPQGTKDLVIYKYAKCLALTDDEEKLAAMMGLIHAELTPAVEAEESAEVEEAQEVEA